MHNLAVHNKSQSVMTVAFSVGFASYKASRRDQKTIEQLRTEANQAMYAEKHSHHAGRKFREVNSPNNRRLPRRTNSSQPKPLLEC